MAQRNNRRDSIVQEREEDSAPFDPSSLPRLAAEPTNVPQAFTVDARDTAPDDVHAPRVIAPIDLSDFRALMDAAKAARERSAGYQQALQQAQVAELKAVGAFEGEYARLRRRYGIGEGEDFDPETGAIVVVQQGQG